MRKLLFRFGIIAVLVIALLDINDNTETNYSTEIKNNITGEVINIPEVMKKVPEFLDKAEPVVDDIVTSVLEMFGYTKEVE